MWYRYESNVTVVANSSAMTASGHKLGIVVQAPKTGSIRKIVWRAGTTSGTASVDVRVETLSSGKPSGTLLATNTNAVQSSVTTGTIYETQLTASAAVTRADFIGIALAYSAGTSITIQLGSNSVFSSNSTNFPGLYLDTGAGYASIASRIPMICLEYDDGTYELPLGCWWSNGTAASTSTFSSGEQGARFRLPFRSSCCGLWHSFDPDADVTFKLYADSTSPGGTVLAEELFPAANFRTANSGHVPCLFPSSVILEANTWYRLVGAVSAASTRYQYYDLQSTTFAQVSLLGADHYQTVSSGSTWTDTTTRLPLIAPILDQLDNGVIGIPLIGSGGLISV